MSETHRAVQGGVRLAFESMAGVTNAVEQMHENIAAVPLSLLPPGRRPEHARGRIAAAVYAGVRGVTRTLGHGVDRALGLMPPGDGARETTTGIRAVAALNGVCGDHLEATGNPLAIDMRLMTSAAVLDPDPAAIAAALPRASGHIVVLVHGLGLSEFAWRRRGRVDLGERLASEIDCTPLYLRYNTGRHISSNGASLELLLARLHASWPVPVESISLVGHSMGGLVIRSACWRAQQSQADWASRLRRVVCLGTPHHGSPVEMAGHLLDRAMTTTRWTAPLAFGRKRSAGIKDLRHGNLLDEDWQGLDADVHRDDRRRVVPLMPGVDHFFAAASLGKHDRDPLGHVLGDVLVRLDSATGAHRDDVRALGIEPSHCRIFHGSGHLDLLDDEQVHAQILEWFRRAPEQSRGGFREGPGQGVSRRSRLPP